MQLPQSQGYWLSPEGPGEQLPAEEVRRALLTGHVIPEAQAILLARLRPAATPPSAIAPVWLANLQLPSVADLRAALRHNSVALAWLTIGLANHWHGYPGVGRRI